MIDNLYRAGRRDLEMSGELLKMGMRNAYPLLVNINKLNKIILK